MSKYVIDSSTLTSIADAVRTKGGTTDPIVVSDIPTAITNLPSGGGGEYFTDEDLTFTGDVNGLFSYDKWKTVIDREKGRIKITNVSDLSTFLKGSTGADYSFLTIEGSTSDARAAYMLYELPNIEKFPVFKNVTINSNQSTSLLSNLYNFTNVDELIKFFDGIKFSDFTFQNLSLFSYCYSLRNIDDVMPYFKKALGNFTKGAGYRYCFSYMRALDEINNIPVMRGNKTSDGFLGAFNYSGRLKNITFETDNGAPIVVQWKQQKIDLSIVVGTTENYNKHLLIQYKSGITADKEVKDDATYQALKNDPDWFTCDVNYSRYNHDSAVATINSLPDTSAYLATAGGTNTIKFQGQAGASTDGGAINTLTEEEIAVAAAKGWTVTLV